MGVELKTSLVRCWKISCQNGKVFCFTDHNKDILHENEIYLSVSPLNMSAIETSIGLEIDNLEISGSFHHSKILESDIQEGIFDQAKIIIFEFDWAQGVKKNVMFQGLFSSYSYGKNSFSIESHSAFGRLGHVFGRGYHLTCDADLGDEKCGIDINAPSYKFRSEIMNFTENGIEIPRVVGISDGRFQHGTAEFFMNDAVTSKLQIKSDKIIGNLRSITFWKKLSPIQQAATRVNIYVGCNKSIECCCHIFDNAINFRGFPHIPSDDWIKVSQED